MKQNSDCSREEALLLWRGALEDAGWLSARVPQEIAACETVGRVTAEPVLSSRPVPHYSCAAMDGIAVRSLDTCPASEAEPVRLRLVLSGEALSCGAACIVDTGDALPENADSIIMREHIVFQGENAIVQAPVIPGRHIRLVGEDIRADDMILPAGREIGPADMAAIMAAGVNRVRVYPRPRVTVIPTGSEIIDSEEPLPAGCIRDVNSYMLAAMFGTWGAEACRHDVVPDDVGQIRAAITGSISASDFVVINAGTSKGSEDFTAGVLHDLGRICCQGVAIRPGRPVILAVLQGKPVIGLPGYPVSCKLTADLFIRDLIHEFQGKKAPERRTIKASLAEDVKSVPGVEEFIRVTLTEASDGIVALPLPRGASLISTLVKAQGLIRIPAGRGGLSSGDEILVELF